MRFKEVLNKTFHNNFVLIHDTKDEGGEEILNEFIKHNMNSQNNTHFVSLEGNPKILRNNFDSKLSYYSFWNSKKWLNNPEQTAKKDENSLPDTLCSILNHSKSESNLVLIIDSLSVLLLRLNPIPCYKLLHRLLNCDMVGIHQGQLISLVHGDVIPGGKTTLKMLEKLAIINIYIDHKNKESVMTIKHRKSSGRIVENTEKFFFDKTGSLVTIDLKVDEGSSSESSGKSQFKSDVTFKLELEEEEKRARSELVLPYIKSSNPSGGGEIIYEPDANDDWDEEDPDDDLDI